RRADCPRDRDLEVAGDGNGQQADRFSTQDQREDGPQPREQHVREARHLRSRPGRPVRGAQGTGRGLATNQSAGQADGRVRWLGSTARVFYFPPTMASSTERFSLSIASAETGRSSSQTKIASTIWRQAPTCRVITPPQYDLDQPAAVKKPATKQQRQAVKATSQPIHPSGRSEAIM